MIPALEEALDQIRFDYEQLLEQDAMSEGTPDRMKNQCISALEARMEAVAAESGTDDEEYKECQWLSGALLKGWLVTDIPMLLQLRSAILALKADSRRTDGERLLSQFPQVELSTLVEREMALRQTETYLSIFTLDPDEKTPAKISKAIHLLTEQHMNRTVYATEYPKDKNFARFKPSDPVVASANLQAILNDHDRKLALAEARDAQVRERTQYTFLEQTPQQAQAEANAPFQPNRGQAHNNITKHNSTAIKEVFGEQVYDEIDAMQQGSVQDRTVKLHHSLGTKWQKEGADVLEMEFAGSGAEDAIKKHRNRGRFLRAQLTPEQEDEIYGEKVKKGKSSTFQYIRRKERSLTDDNNQSFQKLRYTIAGPWPGNFWGAGLFNLGEYSIENTRAYAKRFAREFLEPHFRAWLSGDEEPHDLRLSLEGHSRGAVAAGQAIKLIHQWAAAYAEEHPELKPLLKKHLKYDLRLYDPVPGMITDLHLKSCNLRDIPNLNATVICSMAQNHTDMLFPLQHIKGAKKLILTTQDHMMDFPYKDESQSEAFGDGKDHRLGYYDAETGEMYRGSGLGELPDGVYISDEKNRLVRITSYSQLTKLFKSIYQDESPQRIRGKYIHHMVRDWFVENNLEMSFPDRQTREKETLKNKDLRAKLLNSPNTRLRDVKAQLRALQQLEEQGASKSELIQKNEALMKVCKVYMKKTKLPNEGDSLYRVNLVADLLSFTMRENNQLRKELQLEARQNAAGLLDELPQEKYNSALDDKIAAQRQRMAQKPGYLEQKLRQTQERLNKEKDIRARLQKTVKLCGDQLDALSKTRVGKSPSDSFKKYHAALTQGASLDPDKLNLQQIKSFYTRLAEAANQYVDAKTQYGEPSSTDGGIRVKLARDCRDHSNHVNWVIEKATAHFADRELPLGKRIEYREAEAAELNQQLERRRQAEQAAADARKQPRQPAPPEEIPEIAQI